MGQDQINWQNVSTKTIIPELVVHPDQMQVFMFSAVTWNRHHIHYSKDVAVSEGFPDVVVQRGLIGNFLARLITDWIGDNAELSRLTWKVTRSALPDKDIICRGEIAEIVESEGEKYLVCNVTASNENDGLIASGEARVVFSSDCMPGV